MGPMVTHGEFHVPSAMDQLSDLIYNPHCYIPHTEPCLTPHVQEFQVSHPIPLDPTVFNLTPLTLRVHFPPHAVSWVLGTVADKQSPPIWSTNFLHGANCLEPF